jgi:hypothetical protein
MLSVSQPRPKGVGASFAKLPSRFDTPGRQQRKRNGAQQRPGHGIVSTLLCGEQAALRGHPREPRLTHLRENRGRCLV